ncbi:MAG: hypothetical protein R2742_12500 [Micropruina glycogenica]
MNRGRFSESKPSGPVTGADQGVGFQVSKGPARAICSTSAGE